MCIKLPKFTLIHADKINYTFFLICMHKVELLSTFLFLITIFWLIFFLLPNFYQGDIPHSFLKKLKSAQIVDRCFTSAYKTSAKKASQKVIRNKCTWKREMEHRISLSLNLVWERKRECNNGYLFRSRESCQLVADVFYVILRSVCDLSKVQTRLKPSTKVY